MTHLTALYLDNNSLSRIPSDISRLVNLTHLDLSSNKLRTLPSELGDLVRLRELLLNNNFLRVLPYELGKLFKVRHLGEWSFFYWMCVCEWMLIWLIISLLRNSSNSSIFSILDTFLCTWSTSIIFFCPTVFFVNFSCFYQYIYLFLSPSFHPLCCQYRFGKQSFDPRNSYNVQRTKWNPKVAWLSIGEPSR